MSESSTLYINRIQSIKNILGSACNKGLSRLTSDSLGKIIKAIEENNQDPFYKKIIEQNFKDDSYKELEEAIQYITKYRSKHATAGIQVEFVASLDFSYRIIFLLNKYDDSKAEDKGNSFTSAEYYILADTLPELTNSRTGIYGFALSSRCLEDIKRIEYKEYYVENELNWNTYLDTVDFLDLLRTDIKNRLLVKDTKSIIKRKDFFNRINHIVNSEYTLESELLRNNLNRSFSLTTASCNTYILSMLRNILWITLAIEISTNYNIKQCIDTVSSQPNSKSVLVLLKDIEISTIENYTSKLTSDLLGLCRYHCEFKYFELRNQLLHKYVEILQYNNIFNQLKVRFTYDNSKNRSIIFDSFNVKLDASTSKKLKDLYEDYKQKLEDLKNQV
jgi:hypothetical protein